MSRTQLDGNRMQAAPPDTDRVAELPSVGSSLDEADGSASASQSTLLSSGIDGGDVDLPAPGDCFSVEALIQAYHRDVYAFCYHLTGNAADAEDVCQQCFLSAQNSLGQLREAEKAKSWLLRIAKNCFLKSRRRQRPAAASDVELQLDAVSESDAETGVDEEALRLALQQLPEQQRLILVLFYFRDLSYKDIAEELDLKIGTVMSRISRAKGRLRQLLLKEPTA